MQKILIDAGPLIALFDRSDQYHAQSVSFLQSFDGQLWSTWPVITEVSHMLDFSTRVQLAFLEWIRRGGVNIFQLAAEHVDGIIRLSRKFEDVPMDLADASLVITSEVLSIREIASIDSDFYIYRDIKNQYLNNVFR